jgi:hypothetical protein
MIQSMSNPAADSLPWIPEGHRGPVSLPGTGRTVYWTGRVAIGLRHERAHQSAPTSQSAQWVQELVLPRPVRHGRTFEK